MSIGIFVYCMVFNELVSPSLKELFIKEITATILSGKIRIGEWLPKERELAHKMKVSRAVVNGGLAELSRQGFVTIVPRKGAYVADYKHRGKVETLAAILEFNGGRFDPDMLKSIYESRINTERHVVTLASKNRTQQDIDALYNQLDVLAKLEDAKELSEAGHEFYRILYISSGNLFYPLSVQVHGIVGTPMLEILFRHYPKEIRLEKMRHLVKLIEDRDAQQAADCIEAISFWDLNAVSNHYKAGDILK